MNLHQTMTPPPSAGLLHTLAGQRPHGHVPGLHVRLAANMEEVDAAQALRHRVFYVARGLSGTPHARDIDGYDGHCDHLLAMTGDGAVVGTYRLLTGDAARRGIGFYSEREFDITGFLNAHAGMALLELGRSCVLEPYRSRRTIDALWRGLSDYIDAQSIDVLFGCVSLPGTSGPLLTAQLDFLSRTAVLPAPWQVCARDPSRQNRPLPAPVDERRIFASLPPLVKAYHRLGARFSSTAFADHDLAVTDVFVALRIVDIEQRYLDRFRHESTNAAMPSR